MNYTITTKEPNGIEAVAKTPLTDAELAQLKRDAKFRAGYTDLLARQALIPLEQDARKKALAIAENIVSGLLEIANQKELHHA